MRADLPLLSIVLAGLSMSLGACGPVSAPAPEQAQGRDRLIQQAEIFAQAELARLAAAEMPYRYEVRLHKAIIPELGTEAGVYAKAYRHFRGFEVVDLSRSDSLLHPVRFRVRFTYDVVSTNVHRHELPGALERCELDATYSVLGRRAFERTYKADELGVAVAEADPELPPLDYYDRGRDDSTPVVHTAKN